MNPANLRLINEYKNEIYEAAVEYTNFLKSDKDKLTKDNVFMISKEYLDNFKQKINYNDSIDLFKVNTDENCDKFFEQVKNYSLDDLKDIIFKDIKIFGGFDDLEENIDKGFEFVSKEFLKKIELEAIEDPNFDYYKVKYIKDSNNIIIIFNDESKLFIINEGNGTKCHAIPAPIKGDKNILLKRTKTLFAVGRKRDKTPTFQSKKVEI